MASVPPEQPPKKQSGDAVVDPVEVTETEGGDTEAEGDGEAETEKE